MRKGIKYGILAVLSVVGVATAVKVKANMAWQDMSHEGTTNEIRVNFDGSRVEVFAYQVSTLTVGMIFATNFPNMTAINLANIRGRGEISQVQYDGAIAQLDRLGIVQS